MKTHRLIYLIFLALLTSFKDNISAQDTLVITSESTSSDIVEYLSPLEYAFMMHEETPWMLRVSFPEYEKVSSLESLFDDFGGTEFLGVQVEFERKLFNSYRYATALCTGAGRRR